MVCQEGGLYLRIYQNSLSLIFLILFILSFLLHAYGAMKDINCERLVQLTYLQTFAENCFWFEFFQNWYSEFISVAAIVYFSIYFRQKGSLESKLVEAPNDETGN